MGKWTKVTLKIWITIQRSLGLSKKISSAASIGYLNDFAPSRTDVDFKKWSQHGLDYLHQLCHDGTLKSFEQIRNEFTLPRSDFFRYLQLRHFLTTHRYLEMIKKPSQTF